MERSSVSVRALTPADFNAWSTLFRGYGDFYNTTVTDDIIDQVWQWLCDNSHVLEGFVAVDEQGQLAGLIHVRSCPRSLSGKHMGFLDDMFVSPKYRGSGVADALFEFMKGLAIERDWPAVRCLTQHYNYRGRSFYDQYTKTCSDFIMYQWAF